MPVSGSGVMFEPYKKPKLGRFLSRRTHGRRLGPLQSYGCPGIRVRIHYSQVGYQTDGLYSQNLARDQIRYGFVYIL
jgi:hypothetical protein